ncbi:ribosomal-processing cysteine protease Prp [uncultured Clostridium sp.]|uniref:ribosomal-processing cysteine protease Prp n=1 Tax=uncultured Clostridium sp. TaxID=59620 RepID=UPI0026172187|nr:ribosomal-processing cysteine protease Prp [uncultured Clostridium sp.]
MIKIRIETKSNNIISFTINNHALRERDMILAGEAYDMVCNSVSVLSQSVIIGLDEVLKLNVNYEISDGYLKLDLNGFTSDEINQAQVLLKTFEKSLDSVILSIEQSFGYKKRCEYINLEKEEV